MNIKEVPIMAMKNRKAVEESETCACYHCVTVFSKHDITRWTDNGKTAVCPACDVDCVLPQTCAIPFDIETLQAIHDHWFGKTEL